MKRPAPFGLRLRPTLRQELEAHAAANGRSLHAEIVDRLERSTLKSGGEAPSPTGASPLGALFQRY